MINISLNKNAIKGDKSALNPNGIRIGTPSITTRGLKEKDMYFIANFINIIVTFGKEIQDVSGVKMKEFLLELQKEDNQKFIKSIKDGVKIFINKFEYY